MSDSIDMIVILLAILGLLGVVLEEVIHVNKAQSVLFFGTVSWVLLFLSSINNDMEHAAVITGLQENIGEIASLWLFLISAMTFVVYLNQKGLIETLIYKILPGRVTERKLLIMTGAFAFLFSSIVDNITATLICVALVLSLNLDRRKTLRFAAVVIFGVNSGGVAMITGDVTTLMIFLEGKVTITELILLALPAFGAVMILAVLLARPLNEVAVIQRKSHPLTQLDYIIAIIFAATILSTITGNVMFDIPPVLTFLTGLSVMFLVARAFGQDTEDDPIMNYIRRIEFDTLMFFLGILLLVGALKEIHALDTFVKLYDVLPPWAANYLMGLLSALIDNVPLTAALLKADINMDLEGWLSLTYAVGVGGSLLVIGSAAGIVAMSKLDDLTFGSYMKYAPPLLIAYTSGFVASLMLARILA